MQQYAQNRHSRYPQMGSMARTDDSAFADTKTASSPQTASPMGAPTGTQPDFGRWISAMGGQSSPQKQTAQPDFSQWMRQSQPSIAAPTQPPRTPTDLSQYMQATQARRPSTGMPVDFLDHEPSPARPTDPARPHGFSEPSPDPARSAGFPEPTPGPALRTGSSGPTPAPALPAGGPTPGREVDYYQQRVGDFEQWMRDYLDQENQSRRAFEEWMKGQTEGGKDFRHDPKMAEMAARYGWENGGKDSDLGEFRRSVDRVMKRMYHSKPEEFNAWAKKRGLDPALVRSDILWLNQQLEAMGLGHTPGPFSR